MCPSFSLLVAYSVNVFWPVGYKSLSLALGPNIAALPTSEGDWFHSLCPGCAVQSLTTLPCFLTAGFFSNSDSDAEEITGTGAQSKDSNRCLLLDSGKLFIFPCYPQGCSWDCGVLGCDGLQVFKGRIAVPKFWQLSACVTLMRRAARPRIFLMESFWKDP